MSKNTEFPPSGANTRSRNGREGSVGRGRWKIVLGAGIVVALSVTFAGLTLKALNIRANTSSEFRAYVAQHHLGSVELVDDESGVQTDFAILHLSQPLSSSVLEERTLDLMKTYYSLDGGSHLTIEYSANGRTNVESDAVLLPGTGDRTLAITLHENGQVRLVKEPVQWAAGGNAS